MADGSEVLSKTVTEADEWKWQFEDLPKYEGDKEIRYTITEDPVEDYNSKVDGYDVTNTYVTRTFKITYDLNGGTYNGKRDNIVEMYPEGTVISIHEAPVREGYTFQYWKGSRHMPGDSYKVTGDHIFTAQWKSEKPVTPTPDPTKPPVNPTKEPTTSPSGRVPTGDNNSPESWLMLMGCALASLSILALMNRRKKRNSADGK